MQVDGYATVIGGSGRVGAWICDILSSSFATVRKIELPPVRNHNVEPAGLRSDIIYTSDISACSEALSALENSALVILAVPLTEAARIANVIGRLQGGRKIVVDTFSAKVEWSRSSLVLNSPHTYFGINPLFRPPLMPGMPKSVAIVPYNHSANIIQGLKAILEGIGLHCPVLEPHDHDRLMAVLQTLVHSMVLAFGSVMDDFAVSSSKSPEIVTPPFKTLLELSQRVSHGDPHVYWEIQRYNPESAKMRSAIIEKLTKISEIVDADDYANFTKFFSETP